MATVHNTAGKGGDAGRGTATGAAAHGQSALRRTGDRTRNVRVQTAKPQSSGSLGNDVAYPNVTRKFEEEDSVAARSRQRKKEDAPQNTERGSAVMERVEQQRHAAARKAKRGVLAARAGAHKTGSRGLTRRFSWMGLGIAAYICIWTFVFGLLSLVAFVGEEAASSIFGFIDLSWAFPGQTLGWLFYWLSFLISFVGFLGFLIWFSLLGINVFATETSALIFVLFLSFSIMPILNIAPWLAFWIVYVNLASISLKTSG